MTGRGRSRGRAKVLDQDPSSPGGLASRNSTGEAEDGENAHSDGDDEQTINQAEPVTPNTSGGSTGQPTLSLTDMKSILEDSRTYSEQNDVKRVLLCAKNFVRSQDDVKTLACIIYNKCLEDYSLAKRGSEICDSMTCIEVGNAKFRGCLLSLVQADYKARKELIGKDSCRFSCFLAFLCEIFGIMRTATDEVFKPLINPIFDCFNLILGPEFVRNDDEEEVESSQRGGGEGTVVNDDACEILAAELQSIGRLLEENAEDQMQQLIDNIRTCIINSRSSPRVRCSLLEVVEAYARGWEPANNDTTRFYCDMAVGIISGLVL
ncbi:unnamed protein product [Lymnaea stagnalis]|uniref:CBP80/20-dependent translation initiation factor n=1 Tax=Lymnaea stagnalis TaxID=6523 RepID=A0AAV2IH26_LYMST